MAGAAARGSGRGFRLWGGLCGLRRSEAPPDGGLRPGGAGAAPRPGTAGLAAGRGWAGAVGAAAAESRLRGGGAAWQPRGGWAIRGAGAPGTAPSGTGMPG